MLGAAGSVSAEQASLKDFLKSEKSLYGHGNEELLIRHFFAERRDGVDIDVGCFDYKDWSTTYYLEKHLGGTGIGVDAEEVHRKG
jgi:hypothetical protein